MGLQDYVQYHNTDKLGRKPTYKAGRTGIFWTANRTIPKGARVWLVAGETVAGAKRYWLYDWFIVDKLAVANGERTASGAQFKRFTPPIEIGTATWFPEFRHHMGNFGRGLSPLRPINVRHFEAAARARATALVAVPPTVAQSSVSPPTAPLPATSRPSPINAGGGFGDAAQNREVELAAVSTVTTHFSSKGWTCKSVEAAKCGYDLECRKGNEEWHFEVKGVSGVVPAVILTDGELTRARTDNRWKLIIVTSALGSPVLTEYRGAELQAIFSLRPISYRLIPKSPPRAG